MALTHEQWLGHNLMTHHRTEGSIILKTKEELARERDKLLDTDMHNIVDKNIWMLDMDLADAAVMSMGETQYAIFELKSAQAQDKAAEERTDGKTKDFKKYCNIPVMCVSTMNVFEHKGCLEEEKHKLKNNKRKKLPRQKRSKSNWQGKSHIKQTGSTSGKGEESTEARIR